MYCLNVQTETRIIAFMLA